MFRCRSSAHPGHICGTKFSTLKGNRGIFCGARVLIISLVHAIFSGLKMRGIFAAQ